MNFNIPIPKIPTRKELLPIENKWYKSLTGVKFSDWNDVLNENSYPWFQFSLDWKFIEPLFDYKREDIKNIVSEKINEQLLLHGLTNGFFIKLDTRSPKDFLSDDKNFGKPRKIFTGKEAVEALTASMRTFEDMVSLSTLRKFNLVLRPYIDFHPKNEWRCFIKNEKLVGISQYYYTEHFEDTSAIGITDFINTVVIPNMKVKSFIADVVNEDKPILLETNPWGLSDPCLFKDYNSFDGSILFNNFLTTNK